MFSSFLKNGFASHAEGRNTIALGYATNSSGIASHASGRSDYDTSKEIQLCHPGCCAHWYKTWAAPRIVWCRVEIEVNEWESLKLLNKDLRLLISKKIRNQPSGQKNKKWKE